MRFSAKQRWTFVVRALVSLAALASGLFIILSGAYSDATVKWAFGIVGVVLGYWLR